MSNERILTVCRSVMLSAAALLAGCGATHVGETWQCPLAQGAQCTSVAGADPAIQADDRQAALPPVRAAAQNGVLEDAAGEEYRACTGLCRPFAWLSRLFAGGDTPDAAVVDGADRSAEISVAAVPDAGFRSPADVRLPEKIGRVWIAPWVDDNGVYREGAWVRIVIRPAAWRIP